MKFARRLLFVVLIALLASGMPARAAEEDTATPTEEATFTPEPTLDPCLPQEAGAVDPCLRTDTPAPTDTPVPTFDPCAPGELVNSGDEVVCPTATEVLTDRPTDEAAATDSPVVTPTWPTTISDAVTIEPATKTAVAAVTTVPQPTEAAVPGPPQPTDVAVVALPNTGTGTAGSSSVPWLALVAALFATSLLLRARRDLH